MYAFNRQLTVYLYLHVAVHGNLRTHLPSSDVHIRGDPSY